MNNETAANIAKSLEKLGKAIEEAGKIINAAFVKTESKTENVLPDCPDISFVPRRGDNYYYPNIVSTTLVGTYRNFGDEIDDRLIHHGMCYPYTEGGKKAAILHAKAMLGIAENLTVHAKDNESLFDKLSAERSELIEKIARLEGFMHSNAFATLSPPSQGLIMVQLEAMRMYADTLSRRIEII